MAPKFASSKKWKRERSPSPSRIPITPPSSPSSSSSSTTTTTTIVPDVKPDISSYILNNNNSIKKKYKPDPMLGNSFYNEEQKEKKLTFMEIMEHQTRQMYIRTPFTKCTHIKQKENTKCAYCDEFVNVHGTELDFKQKMILSSTAPYSPANDPNFGCDNPSCSNKTPSWIPSSDVAGRILCKHCGRTSITLTVLCDESLLHVNFCPESKCPLDPLINMGTNEDYYCVSCKSVINIGSLKLQYDQNETVYKTREYTGVVDDEDYGGGGGGDGYDDDSRYKEHFQNGDGDGDGDIGFHPYPYGGDGYGIDYGDIDYGYDDDPLDGIGEERDIGGETKASDSKEEKKTSSSSSSSTTTNESALSFYVSCKSDQLLDSIKPAVRDLCNRIQVGEEHMKLMVQYTTNSIVTNISSRYFEGKNMNVHRKTRVRFLVESFRDCALSTSYNRVFTKDHIVSVMTDIPKEHISTRMINTRDNKVINCLGTLTAHTENVIRRLAAISSVKSGKLTDEECHILKVLSSWAICMISVMNLVHPDPEIVEMSKDGYFHKFTFTKDAYRNITDAILIKSARASSREQFYNPLEWVPFVHKKVQESVIRSVESKLPKFKTHTTGIVTSKISAFAGALVYLSINKRISKPRGSSNGGGPSACRNALTRRKAHKERPAESEMIPMEKIAQAAKVSHQTLRIATSTLMLMYHILMTGKNEYYPCHSRWKREKERTEDFVPRLPEPVKTDYLSSSSSSSPSSATQTISTT